jgi:hypothetical protein
LSWYKFIVFVYYAKQIFSTSSKALDGGRMAKQRKNYMDIFLNTIERVGNFLPHPGTLFALFAGLVVIFSGIFAQFDIAVVHPGTGETIAACQSSQYRWSASHYFGNGDQFYRLCAIGNCFRVDAGHWPGRKQWSDRGNAQIAGDLCAKASVDICHCLCRCFL